MSLVCWLPLNTTTATNKGASVLDVSQSNITLGTNGKIGNCFTFNGSNSTVSIAGTALYDCFKGGANPFSVCMWVYNSDGNGSTQANRAVFFGDYSLSGAINVNIEKTNAGLARFYWGGNPDWSVSGATIAANAWTHLVFSYDGSNVYCYINGVLKGTRSGTLATKSKTSGNFQLGRDSRTGDTAFTGRMNDFRVYNHCLSLKEIKELYKCLILHYAFDFAGGTTTGTSMPDNSGLGGVATLTNITASTTTPFGVNSAVFNGSSSYINQTVNITGEPMTFTCWVKFGATGSYHIIDFRNSSGVGYQPFYGGTGYGLQFYSSNSGSLSITAADCAFNTTNWFFLAGVLTATDCKVYINGVLKGTSTTPKTSNYGDTSFRVGTRCSGANWFNGNIADVRIYANEFSADDILDMYNTKAYILKNGILNAGQFTEEDMPNFDLPTRSYVVKANQFVEGSSEVGLYKGDTTGIVPEGYTKLDYIESSGTQYINTGYYWHTEVSKIYANFRITSQSTYRSI